MAKVRKKLTTQKLVELQRRLDKLDAALRERRQKDVFRRRPIRIHMKDGTVQEVRFGSRIFFDEPLITARPASPFAASKRNRGRPSAKALIADEIERRQKTPQRWPKNTFRSVVAQGLWDWLEARRRSDKNIPRVKNSRAMASLLQRNQLWPPAS